MRRLVTFLFVSGGLLLALLCGIGAYLATHNWVDLSALERTSGNRATILLDDKGHEWTRFQLDRREPIPLSAVPKNLIQAFLATEDHAFFDHYGISLRGIARSIFVNLIKGKKVQGASTITQQLVRLLFLNYERTFTRKTKEQLLSIIVEYQFTKEQILEAYLNNIYFGSDIYGVQAAAERFWGIPAHELKPHQSAVLAAIVRSPNHYCPLFNPQAALQRRDLVLKLMYQRGYLAKDALDHELKQPLALAKKKQVVVAPHFREAIRQILEDKFGHHVLYTGGLVVQTTLNRTAQIQAEKVFTKHLEELSKIDDGIDGALVCLDARTAGIQALIGGRDFASSQFNRALQAHRQMGSTFKPLVYTTVIEAGLHKLNDTLIDEPFQSVENWDPQNVQEKFEGTITLAHALMVSNNIIPVKLFLEVGAQKVIDCAKRFHLTGALPPYPSLALGCTESTPLQSAALFNTFTNKGVYQEPYMIEWVKDGEGRKVLKHYPKQEQAIAWSVSSQIVQGLRLVTQHLKEKLGRWVDGDSAGKTGTTNENRTCWFAGMTPTQTTVIFLGRDDNRSLKNKIFSSWHACPIWVDFNQTIENPTSGFSLDPNLQKIVIDKRTGQPSTPDQEGAVEILV